MYKTKLQEMCQKRRWKLPEYSTVRNGPSHNVTFTATVTVNGVTFSSPQACRSTKEAQNTAANIAFSALSATDQQLDCVNGFPPQPHGDLSLANAVNEAHLGGELMRQNDNPIHKGTSHVYKNQLQQYAQKNNLAFPVYRNEFDGPPHARRFRSTVSVGGKEYKAHEFFSTVKEAEQAAAQIACQELSVDLNQEDAGLYKNLLQELSQKRGLVYPTYENSSSGLSHNLSFSSTVEVQGCKYEGPKAKSKKQAEMMAAKVAYLTLTKGPPVSADMPQHVQLTAPVANDPGITNEEAKNHQEEPSTSQMTMVSTSHLPDPNLISGNSNLVYSQTENLGNALEFKASCEKSKILVVPRNSNYPIPIGAVMQMCNEEWVAYEINE